MLTSGNKIVIIGAGPAGLSLSATLKIAGIDHLILEKSKKPGGQISFINNNIDDIIIGNISNGTELVKKLSQFVKGHKLPIIYDCNVIRLDSKNKSLIVSTNNLKTEIKYHILVIATGSRLKHENIFHGFDEHIYYRISEHMDDFNMKSVAIIGSGDNSAIAALKLSEIASNVFLINRSDSWKARKDLMAQINNNKNIEVITRHRLKSISGSNTIEKITLAYNKNEMVLKVDKVVFKIGYQPNTEFLNNEVKMTADGYLICDENFRTSDISIYGIGDVVSCSFKRISIAMGQGTQLGILLA